MTYKITFKPSFFKDIKKLPKTINKRFTLLIDEIIKDPLYPPAKKLSGYTDLYRCRLGDYRLVFYRNQRNKKLIFLLIAHRKDIYRYLKKL